MAHAMKLKRGAVYNALAHDDRSQEHIGNVDVDAELSYMNTVLHSGDSWENYKVVMDSSEVHCCKRADVNALCSWVITSPLKADEVGEDVINRFFDICHKFLTERYGVVLESGDSNIVSSVSHFDETTPHLHFKFVPLVPDGKHGGYKVSAKEVLNRADLKSFHKDLQTYLDDRGMYFQIVNDVLVDKDYNKSIKELKRDTKALEQSKRKELAVLDAEIGSKTALVEKLDKKVNETEKALKTANTSLQTTQRSLLELQQEVERLEQYADVLDVGLKASLELEKLNKQVADLCKQLGLQEPLAKTEVVEERRKSLTEQIKKAKPIVDRQKALKPLKTQNTKPKRWDR